jgi:uncharacterized protein
MTHNSRRNEQSGARSTNLNSDRKNGILATPTAVAALQVLRGIHGPVVLHITGGTYDSGASICLPAGELAIGSRDVHLGTIDGVDVYEMRSRPEGHYGTDLELTLEVGEGIPDGFSLSPGPGQRFKIRERVEDSPEWQAKQHDATGST